MQIDKLYSSNLLSGTSTLPKGSSDFQGLLCLDHYCQVSKYIIFVWLILDCGCFLFSFYETVDCWLTFMNLKRRYLPHFQAEQIEKNHDGRIDYSYDTTKHIF